MNIPIVSICCLAYNHEKYIKKCLDGFLMQKTRFAFEVLIHDDASTDNTAKIIREYEKNYPEVIKPIYQTENQYSKAKSVSANYNFPRAKGKYIAMCEGDDYWTDSLKLQKQFDFMQNNKDCSLVFHSANRINTENKIIGVHGPKTKLDQCFYYISDAVFKCNTLVPTNSMFFETKYIKNIPKWALDAPVGDLPLTLLLAHNGKLGFINQVMSNYRVMTQSSWSKKMIKNSAKRKIHDKKIKIMWTEFDVWSNFNYTKIIRNGLIIRNYSILKRELKIKYSYFFNTIKNNLFNG